MGEATRLPQMDKESAYLAIRQAIVTGQLAPGSPVSERELAETYGISRTPIREILHRLQLNGLVEIYPQRGAFVRRLDPVAIMEIFEVREGIESLAAGLAAERCSRSELARIRERLERLELSDDPATLESATRMGSELHDAICRWAGNSMLSEVYARLKDQASLIRVLTRRSREIEESSRLAHLAICEAIGRGERGAAEEAMRDHLVQTRSLLLNRFR